MFPKIAIFLIFLQNFGQSFNLFDEVKKRLMPANAPFIAKELFMTIFEDSNEHDAKFLNKTMQDFGTNKDILVEILVTRSNKQLRAIKKTYKEMFGHDLAKDIEAKTEESYQTLLLDLLEADRDESNATDIEEAKKDANRLYKAGEKKWGTDEDIFIEILANQNVQQLRLVFAQYEKLHRNSMENALKAEFSGDELDAFMDIVGFIRQGPAGILAKMMQKVVKGDTNDELLVHLIYSYKKLNLIGVLQEEFKQGFKGPLAQAIKDRAKASLLKSALINLISG